ncbi:hypothetical protein Dsin_014567 [Dipteronia sinensis]|uniref:Uncharacterized protein n=1 Tax=Dipteronia sinensis TaxID=43782 RepID=A0AAE0EAF8_9ROSI|nr:hypothetical protein Dsin_014567 [Dipteronia sinensis]
MSNDDGSHKMHLDKENNATKSLSSSPLQFCLARVGRNPTAGEKDEQEKDKQDIGDDGEPLSPSYRQENGNAGPVDFENDGLLWLPPEPEDEREAGFTDDDDDGVADATGEWGYWHNLSSFGSGEYRNKDKSGEENKKVMKNVVDGHFRAW